MAIVIFSFLFFCMVYAWPREGPQETRATLPQAATLRLEPTPAPVPHADLELFRRQNSIGTSICGYVSGDLCE
jgi:hypothetical protein